MSQPVKTPLQAGVLNPFAFVELRLRRSVDWKHLANPRLFIETVLGMSCEKLFDPQQNSPLFHGFKYDPKQNTMVQDPSLPDAATLIHRALTEEPNEAAQRAGALRLQIVEPQPTRLIPHPLPLPAWETKGNFFLNGADYRAPVQGATPDCHFISAMAALAWAYPPWIAQRTRPLNMPDALASGNTIFSPEPGAIDMIPFYSAPGSTPIEIQIDELIPVSQPGANFIYARSGNPGETWPAIYEKAWVKWFTDFSGVDTPDYTQITGGDPIADLVGLTGWAPTYKNPASMTANQIWTDVRSNCRGAWTFNPMAACTYASASASPSPSTFNSSGLVAWHCYAILGWIYASNQEYIVLRNPWGNTPATLDVDNGPWVPIEQFGASEILGLTLPADGVFALRADIFQQCFAGYGWVTASPVPSIR
jgi:hypothetical protein